jgi:hypothetical protein
LTPPDKISGSVPAKREVHSIWEPRPDQILKVDVLKVKIGHITCQHSFDSSRSIFFTAERLKLKDSYREKRKNFISYLTYNVKPKREVHSIWKPRPDQILKVDVDGFSQELKRALSYHLP